MSDTTGLFNPIATGGPNAGPGYRNTTPLANPWDFVLAVEGSRMLAGAATRRYRGVRSGPAFPFCVRLTPAGHPSLSDRENVRAELWLPLWNQWAGYDELKALFAEGRVQVGRRHAERGVDFVRALARLGTDRGFTRYERYTIAERNGQSHLAVALGSFKAGYRQNTRLLDALDDWISNVQRVAGTEQAPASLRSAWRRFLDLTFAWCQAEADRDRQRAAAVLRSLAELEHALIPRRGAPEHRVPPIHPLAASWLQLVGDHTPEFRIAQAVSSVFARTRAEKARDRFDAMRGHVEPICWYDPADVHWAPDSVNCVWVRGQLVSSLTAVLHRRLLCADQWTHEQRVWFEAETPVPTLAGELALRAASLDDVVAFIDQGMNDAEVEQWILTLSLIDWPRVAARATARRTGREDVGASVQQPIRVPRLSLSTDQLAALIEKAYPRNRPLHPLYGLLRLCLSGGYLPDRMGRPIPPDAQLVRLAAAGRAVEAGRRAARRLRAAGYKPRVSAVPVSAAEARRVAAALLIPISLGSLAVLADQILGEVPMVEVVH